MALKIHNSCLLIIAVRFLSLCLFYKRSKKKSPYLVQGNAERKKEEYEASQKPYNCVIVDIDPVRINATYINTCKLYTC